MAPRISEKTTSLLELLQWPKVGPVKVREVVRSAGPGESPIDFVRRRFPELADRADADRDRIRAKVDSIIDACELHETFVLSLLDATYPDRLRNVDDAPPFLFVKGAVGVLSLPAVAVVGTREASEAGLKAAHTIADYLVKRNIVVVSGLALGIDAAAHEGALDGNGVTIAILAHGLHMVAPTTNRPIAERLLERGGALVSEHQPGVPPRPQEFARRNRIQSGMSLASVIVESGESGGAMIQANFTRQQRRPIFAVMSEHPGFNSGGANRLVKDFGASIIRRTSHLGQRLDEILLNVPHIEAPAQKDMDL